MSTAPEMQVVPGAEATRSNQLVDAILLAARVRS
jgi:hypothetical protein